MAGPRFPSLDGLRVFETAARAESFARAGMADETLQWLEKAVEHGSYKMTYLAFWPHLDFVRDDARYQDLLERVYGEKAQEVSRAADSRTRDR